jgi:hypothetical protein
MTKHIRTWALIPALALVALPALADAQQTRNWFVCGGNHFDTCASVFVTVSGDADFDGVSNVELKIWNLSGLGGTFAGTVFTKIGFFHQNYQSGGSIDAEALAPLVMDGPVLNDPDQWELGSPNNAGGIELDLAANNGNGVSDGIANACDTDLLPGGQNAFWLNPCGTDGFANNPDAPGWITINFDVDGTWDLATTELLIFGQNGPDGLSTQCITGEGGNCSVVPEPSTWLLLGTGLGALGLVHVRRRRREDELADAA